MTLSLRGIPLVVLVPRCDESPTTYTDATQSSASTGMLNKQNTSAAINHRMRDPRFNWLDAPRGELNSRRRSRMLLQDKDSDPIRPLRPVGDGGLHRTQIIGNKKNNPKRNPRSLFLSVCPFLNLTLKIGSTIANLLKLQE